MLAGSEKALSQLPKGKWIGGTSVYFVTETGGRVDHDNIYVTEIEAATNARAVIYQGEDLPNLTMNRFDGGLTMILIPAFSTAHSDFAIHGAEYSGLFDQPLMGWITGIHLDDLGKATPKVFDGATGTMHEDGAAVLHVALDGSKAAELDILNLFEQDDDADVFAARATGDGGNALSCNCILNYLYGELEGKTTGSFTGPATFGEIAYVLLNQTLVKLDIHAAEASAVA